MVTVETRSLFPRRIAALGVLVLLGCVSCAEREPAVLVTGGVVRGAGTRRILPDMPPLDVALGSVKSAPLKSLFLRRVGTGLIVRIYRASGSKELLARTQTDSKGCYRVRIPVNALSIRVVISEPEPGHEMHVEFTRRGRNDELEWQLPVLMFPTERHWMKLLAI